MKLPEQNYTLLKRKAKYDVFTDGDTVYAGDFHPLHPSCGYEIDTISLRAYGAPLENYIKKMVAKARKCKPVTAYIFNYYQDDEMGKFEIVGYRWEHGLVDLISKDGKLFHRDSVLRDTPKTAQLVAEFKKVRQERRAIQEREKKLEKKLNKLKYPWQEFIPQELLTKMDEKKEEDS